MKTILATLAFAALAGVTATAPAARAGEPTKAAAKAPAKQEPPKVFTSQQKVGTKATCPVTGEQFTIAKDTVHEEYKGKHVYFCCPGCKKTFDKDPEKYTK
jgi:YHS domain-containing protein